jgi:hypothetical protein
MMTDPVIPAELNNVDFTRVIFSLEFLDTCQLDTTVLLGFRSLMRPVAKQVFADDGAEGKRRFKALFEPAISHDPVALKKFQKPSPPFVLLLKPMPVHVVNAGDSLDLELLFLGTSIPLICDFLACLILLGRFGLVGGHGKYDVVEMSAVGQDEQVQHIWQRGCPADRIAPPLDSIGLWLERQLPVALPLSLQFEIPARLMVNGRPVRRPSFAALFPFMLRRVTSMLHAHAGCELMLDAADLLGVAESVSVAEAHFDWNDWRDLSGNRPMRAIGGFTGRMSLDGKALRDIFWVIAVASLFGLGKGAAYGAGRFSLGLPEGTVYDLPA